MPLFEAMIDGPTTSLRSLGSNPLSLSALARRSNTNSFRRAAYSHPAGDRSESALYECSINDWPDLFDVSISILKDTGSPLKGDLRGRSRSSGIDCGYSLRRRLCETMVVRVVLSVNRVCLHVNVYKPASIRRCAVLWYYSDNQDVSE